MDKITAKRINFCGEEGFTMKQYHNGKLVMEQFIPRYIFKEYFTAAGAWPHMEVNKTRRYLSVSEMRAEGYPLRIRGNDGYKATLVGMQPLLDGDWEGIYRYPGGDCVHDLDSIVQFFDILEW